MNRNQQGNVLFLILIAVALFAALSYAVTSSNRSGKTNMTSESGEIVAGRILNFTTAVQGAVLRLSTVKGLPAQELKYNNDVSMLMDNTTYTMGAMGTPSDPSIYVFHPQGGNIPAQKFEDAITACSGCSTANPKSGHFAIYWTPAPGVGITGTSDVILMIQDLRDDACLAINKKVGISFIPNIVFGGGMIVHDTATPPTTQSATSGVTTADLNAIDGKLNYCFKKTNGAVRNQFISVLKAY